MNGTPVRRGSGVGSAHQWRMWLSGLVGSRYDGLAHFHVVEPNVLMRCGQPRVGDLEYLQAEFGLRTVVCARGGIRHPLRGRWYPKERAWCARNDVEFVHMPFSDAAAPPADVFDRFLEIVARPGGRPVLVHCEQGFHRTGILCAAYRLRVDGWTQAEALAEMRALGFDAERPKRVVLLDALQAWAGRAGLTASGT